MTKEKKLIQLLLSIIKRQNKEITSLEEEIDILKKSNLIDSFDILNAITKEYDSYLNGDADLKGSFEGIAELFNTKLSNILCFLTDNPERKGNITRIILINSCESKINTYRVTNEITYRIKLSGLKSEIDKQNLHFAQISRKVYINVAHFELYNLDGKTIAKSKILNIRDEYSKLPVSANYINTFNETTKNHDHIVSHKREIDKKLSIQETKV
jgi:hypothetical protein